MIFRMYRVLIGMFYLSLSTTIIEVDRAILNVRTLFPPKNREKIHISINVDYLLTPSVSMFIEGLSLEARHAAQAERRSANTATAPTSVAAAAAADAILRSLPTHQNGFHCLSANPRVRRWTDPCHRR